jgi:curli production assembly/transport component CsgG
MFRSIVILLLTLLLVSCAGKPDFDIRTQPVQYKELTEVKSPKGDPIIIAVYDFLDMTGQKKPGGNFASMSTAVTQGSYQLLIKALADAGDGKWFRVVERASLPSLLQERKLIRSTRQQVNGEGAEPLPPLLFAGAYITGGIVGYDSDVKTGGFGARILGIQAHKQWRQDVVTIILRLVNVQTGEVIVSLTVEKTIISGETGSDIFKYLDTDTMLVEIEAGVARNEPVTYAVRKAIEKGVVELINQGAEKGIWEFEMVEVVIEPTKDLKVVEDITVDIGEVKPEKTYEDFKKEKKAKKELKKARKLEVKNYNKENNTEFKTWDELQAHLAHLEALKTKEVQKEDNKKKKQEEIEDEKAWEEVDEKNNDDSVDSNSINE